MTKVKKSTMCKICGENPAERMGGGLYKKNLLHRKMAEDFCEEQEALYGNQKLKPIWKKCCGSLNYYLVTIKNPKKDYPSYQTSR